MVLCPGDAARLASSGPEHGQGLYRPGGCLVRCRSRRQSAADHQRNRDRWLGYRANHVLPGRSPAEDDDDDGGRRAAAAAAGGFHPPSNERPVRPRQNAQLGNPASVLPASDCGRRREHRPDRRSVHNDAGPDEVCPSPLQEPLQKQNGQRHRPGYIPGTQGHLSSHRYQDDSHRSQGCHEGRRTFPGREDERKIARGRGRDRCRCRRCGCIGSKEQKDVMCSVLFSRRNTEHIARSLFSVRSSGRECCVKRTKPLLLSVR
mmetsp:Transcript_80326/g.162709  ORF Transcript_80326/g.162709 Transcript_80326/m.162709 type:complete len:261 (-) Transcript_80326:3240-4022(-)